MRNQFNAGYGPVTLTAADVATAEAQVFNTEAQAINVGVQRAQFEHAIAMLIGRPPAELTIAPHLLAGGIPKIPVAVPSSLLERRPDIAAAERTMQEQNALIGVAVAAYFPDISLSGDVGMDRHAIRCRSMSPTRCGRSARPERKCCSMADCAARRSTPRAPPIGRASPIIGRRC